MITYNDSEAFESVVDYDTVLDNFEGPLDFLLFLINRERIEIKDIFVSKVTEQFLDYVRNMPDLDIEKAGEYLAIAATILEIKARSLVPCLIEDEDFAMDYYEDDPKEELKRALEEYKIYKEESAKLKELERLGHFFKEPDAEMTKARLEIKNFTLDNLLSAFTEVMMKREGMQKEQRLYHEIPKEVYTVADKVQLIRRVVTENEEVEFSALFNDDYSKNEKITTFQALLELLKHQYVCVKQEEQFGPILITLNPNRNEGEEIGELDEYN